MAKLIKYNVKISFLDKDGKEVEVQTYNTTEEREMTPGEKDLAEGLDRLFEVLDLEQEIVNHVQDLLPYPDHKLNSKGKEVLSRKIEQYGDKCHNLALSQVLEKTIEMIQEGRNPYMVPLTEERFLIAFKSIITSLQKE